MHDEKLGAEVHLIKDGEFLLYKDFSTVMIECHIYIIHIYKPRGFSVNESTEPMPIIVSNVERIPESPPPPYFTPPGTIPKNSTLSRNNVLRKFVSSIFQTFNLLCSNANGYFIELKIFQYH